jgi:rhodanese-related sulfurtransferase
VSKEEVATISREELWEKIEGGDDFVLVDVLDEQFYRHSHLPGAINIPLDEIGTAEEALPDKDTEIIVYCMDPP